MASKRTAGLLAACVVAAIVVAGLLTTCEETVNSPPEAAVATPAAAAAEPATTKPVAQRRVRALKSDDSEDTTTISDDAPDGTWPIPREETGPFVVVPVEVVDAETGRPIAGATLRTSFRAFEFGAGPASDADGRIAARLRPDALLEIATRAAAHVASTDYVRTAPVGAAQPTLRVELVSGGTLRGIVSDPDGKPVAGAVVDVLGTDAIDGAQRERTAADGSYLADGLVFGASYTVDTDCSYGDEYRNTGAAVASRLVATREHPVVVADLRLRRLGTVDLTVLDGDEPIDESLRVKFVVMARNDQGAFRSSTGSGEPLLVPPGRVTLTARFDDRAPATATVDVPEGATVKTTIHLTRGATISGLVVDDAGAPVEDAWIRDGMSLDNLSGHRADTRSGADGRFELELLAAGDHRLTVSPPYEYEDALIRSVAAPSENVRLVVPHRGVLKVRAVFDDDAKPAPAARIAFHGTLDGKPWDIDRTLPRDGRFEIPWPQGVSGDVGIAVDGFVPVTRNVTVTAGATVDLGEIRMQPACALSGVLHGDDGAPLKEATLVVRGAMGDRKCKTDADGRFSFRGLSSGALRLDLAESPHASFRVDVPSAKDVVLATPESGLLQVFASNWSSGQRLAAWRIDVLDADGVTVDSGKTDANGSWTSHLVPGRYSVSVELGPRADAEVRADDVTVLRLR